MKWRVPADEDVVEAVIAIFREPVERSLEQLAGLRESSWVQSYHWLDASGMALYFLDRLQALGIENAIPAATLERLQQNLADNRMRSAVMFAEFCSLNQSFQAAGVRYANEKGFTLSPESCPEPGLRCQLDLDFLVDGRDLNLCREILAKTGYVRTVATSTEWQFEAGSSEPARIEDLYKPKPQRSVELHFTCSDTDPLQPTRDERLDRLTLRAWNGHRFPVLSPSDQFAAQSLHLLSHLRSAATRPAWLLEYKRHMAAHYDEQSFWEEVRKSSQTSPDAPIAIGLAILLSTRLFGGGAPPNLNEWTLDPLPATVRLWADTYGRKAILADGPGTKLYLLLEDEIARDEISWRRRRRNLLPLYCATKIANAEPKEGLRKRLRREYYQLRYMLFRLRFHVIEGIRYLIESVRWKYHIRTLNQKALKQEIRGASCISGTPSTQLKDTSL
jgi:hypothetical protein